MAGNTSSGVPVIRETEWKRFDKLPLEFRRLFAFAPYEYRIPATMNDTLPQAIEAMLRDRDRNIAKTYGKDHPQIGSRTPERNPRRARA